MYKTVFIDLDDTLWDFSGNSKIAMKHVYQQFDFSRYYPDYETFFTLYHTRNSELWALFHHGRLTKDQLMHERIGFLLRRVGIDDSIGLVHEINESYFAALKQQSGLCPYALELLQYLTRKQYPLFILSNGFSEVQFAKMEQAGIRDFFSGIILSEEAGVNKPHPDIFRYALKKAGSFPEETVMIGDNYDADIQGAQAAGIDQIFYNPNQQEITAEPPTFTVFSLDEIPGIL